MVLGQSAIAPLGVWLGMAPVLVTSDPTVDSDSVNLAQYRHLCRIGRNEFPGRWSRIVC